MPRASVWEGEAVTLHCGAHINKQGTQLQYRYSKDNGTVRGAGSQDQHSIPAAGLSDTGRYQCEVEAAGMGLKKRSASVSLTVRALFSSVTLTASPGATVKEGEALNLTCEAAVNKTPRSQLHYTIVRDGEPVTNSTDSALYSIASTEKSHTGSYTCAVESQGVKKSSQELHIELQTLFSRETLTASPGATVKEGEALNLTCEAAVNKTPRPELHYTIVRDGEPVTNSTDSALYSIASTEKSHTGSYTCAVESQGVKKSSQELHIELQRSKLNSEPSLCVSDICLRKTLDQDQEQSAEEIELSSRVQHTGVELE
ncbi:UNVERIFIED_CONTAM: hypothetical protein FKN15_072426 [Acipenser sinensis]